MNDFNLTDAGRADLAELLHGGFAPVVILLNEVPFNKTAIMLDGLPFSCWSLLEHMRKRQKTLLQFMQSPNEISEVWPPAYWPSNSVPENEKAWQSGIEDFEKDLLEMIRIVEDTTTPLFERQENGKTFFWAATAALQHNAYHIGQIKAIGRQVGVW